MQADGTLVFAAEPSFRKLMTRIGTHEDAGEMAIGRPVAGGARGGNASASVRRLVLRAGWRRPR